MNITPATSHLALINSPQGPSAENKSMASEDKKITSIAEQPTLTGVDLSASLAQANEVDMNKVNQIQQALNHHSFQFDADSLAEAMLGIHQS